MDIYQLRIGLKHSKPEIWRRVLVSANTELAELHSLIQFMMFWSDSHLHHFISNNVYYEPKDEDEDGLGEFFTNKTMDYTNIKVSQLLKKEKDTIEYEYDFGDNWEMKILLEKITQVDEEAFKPICLKAINSAPMEDCGGIMGYYYILDVLKDPKNKEYESIKEWMGFELEEEWDAKEGELEAINYNFKRFAKAVK